MLKLLASLVFFLVSMSVQAYPDRPIQMIVPYSAGGIADIMARVISEQLSVDLKKPVIVVNKGGANGVVGARFVAKAKPDGYNLLFTPNTPLSINPLTQKNLPYDPIKDIEILSIIAESPIAIVTRKNLGVKNLKEMASMAKNKEGGLNYSAVSIAGVLTLPMYKIQNALGFDMTPIPYQGASEAMNAVISGDVDVGINALASALPFIESGKVSAIAIGTEKRIIEAPDVETLEEALPGFKSSIWYSISVPRGMKEQEKKVLISALDKLRENQGFIKFLKDNYLDLPEKKDLVENVKYLENDILKWKEVIENNSIVVN